jgi:hypothetical protein
MPRLARKFTVAVIAVALTASMAQVTSAAPVVNGAAVKNAVPTNVESVQWRRWWWTVPAGVAAGVIVGRALTAPYRYGPGYYGYYGYYGYPYGPPPAAYHAPPGYYGAPGYAAPGPGYAAPGPGYAAPRARSADAVAYCRQRFKSYDVRSGTYLGTDGRRHPCP